VKNGAGVAPRHLILVGVVLVAAALASLSPRASAVPANACPRGAKQVIYHGQQKCLSAAQRKLIYWQLVRYQDTHPGHDTEAYYVIARRWRIPVAATRLIAVEGSVHMWPTPPYPGS
jgi:hypothetical protein